MSARIVINLSRHLRRRLKRERRKTNDANLRIRIQVVLLYDREWGCTRIAESIGCAPATAVRVARRFQEEGEPGLLDRRVDNGESKVDADTLQALEEMIELQPGDYGWMRSTWSRELLAKTLRSETGVSVSTRTVGRMLDHLNARYGVARPVGRLEWSKARKSRRVKQILAVVENLPRNEVAYYQDEVDVHLNPKIGRDWMLRSKQKEVITPGQNRKRYIYGALAVDGDDLIYMSAQRKNSDAFVRFLERLRRANPRARRIHLVLDNYIIHKSKRTQRYLAEHPDLFVLHFLPPYSPETNKIERLWRDLHGNVTRNHRCESIEELMKRVRYWLSKEGARRRRRARASATTRRRIAA